MIYSTQVAEILANQNQQLAPAMSSYGPIGPTQPGPMSMDDPRFATGGMWGPPQGMPFVYGNPIGSEWATHHGISQISLGAMHGGRHLGAAGVFGMTLAAGMVPGVPGVLDPFGTTLRSFGAAGSPTFRAAGLAARGEGFLSGAWGAIKAGRVGTLARGIGAGMIGALPVAAAYYTGYKAATFGVENLFKGAEEQLATNATLLNYGTRFNLPNMAGKQWTYADMVQMNRSIYSTAMEAGPWATPSEVTEVLGQGLQSGMFRRVGSQGELQGALRELVGALKETARSFNTSLSGAMPILQQYRQLGFTGFDQAAGVAKLARGYSVSGGLSPDIIYAAGQQGLSNALQVGATANQARASVLRSMEYAGRIGFYAQQGAVTDDMLLEMTGQVGEAGRAAFAGRMQERAQGLLHTRFGRMITMSMMDPETGEFNSDRSGNLGSIGGMLRGAQGSMRTQSGRLRWMLHKGRIGQQAISEMGPDEFSGTMLSGLSDYVNKNISKDPEIADLLIERMTGIGQRESRMLRQLAMAAPQLRDRARLAAMDELRKVEAEASYRENTSAAAVMRKLELALIEPIRKPIREAGSNILTNLNQGVTSAIEDFMGVRRTFVSPIAAKALNTAITTGDMGMWNALGSVPASSPVQELLRGADGAMRGDSSMAADPTWGAGSGGAARALAGYSAIGHTGFGLMGYSGRAISALGLRAGSVGMVQAGDYMVTGGMLGHRALTGFGSGLRAASNAELALMGELGIRNAASAVAKAGGGTGALYGGVERLVGASFGRVAAAASREAAGMYAFGVVPRAIGGAARLAGGAINVGAGVAAGAGRVLTGPVGAVLANAAFAGYDYYSTARSLMRNSLGPEFSALMGGLGAEEGATGGQYLEAIRAGSTAYSTAGRVGLKSFFTLGFGDLTPDLARFQAQGVEGILSDIQGLKETTSFKQAARVLGPGSSIAEDLYAELRKRSRGSSDRVDIWGGMRTAMHERISGDPTVTKEQREAIEALSSEVNSRGGDPLRKTAMLYQAIQEAGDGGGAIEYVMDKAGRVNWEGMAAEAEKALVGSRGTWYGRAWDDTLGLIGSLADAQMATDTASPMQNAASAMLTDPGYGMSAGAWDWLKTNIKQGGNSQLLQHLVFAEKMDPADREKQLRGILGTIQDADTRSEVRSFIRGGGTWLNNLRAAARYEIGQGIEQAAGARDDSLRMLYASTPTEMKIRAGRISGASAAMSAYEELLQTSSGNPEKYRSALVKMTEAAGAMDASSARRLAHALGDKAPQLAGALNRSAYVKGMFDDKGQLKSTNNARQAAWGLLSVKYGVQQEDMEKYAQGLVTATNPAERSREKMQYMNEYLTNVILKSGSETKEDDIKGVDPVLKYLYGQKGFDAEQIKAMGHNFVKQGAAPGTLGGTTVHRSGDSVRDFAGALSALTGAMESAAARIKGLPFADDPVSGGFGGVSNPAGVATPTYAPPPPGTSVGP